LDYIFLMSKTIIVYELSINNWCALAAVAFYMPSLWIVLFLDSHQLWFWGIAVAADASLMFEQVHRYRGSMMSLRVAFAEIGSAMVSVGLFRMLRDHLLLRLVWFLLS
jgi:hypothetical protein